MGSLDYQKAKAAGYTDDEIKDFVLQKRAAGEDFYIDKSTLPQATPSRGPLDPFDQRSMLGRPLAAIQKYTPEFIKRPASAVARGFAERLSSGAAALMQPLAPAMQSIGESMRGKYAEATGQPAPEPLPPQPRMESIPDQLGRVGRAFAFGESPVPGVDDPRLAMDELTRRTIGDYHAMTPEQADAVSRASLGFPTGEIARSMLGTEGFALLGMTPAARMMDAAAAVPFAAGRAGINRIPWVAGRKAVKEAKTGAVREQIAQEAEQGIALGRLREATKGAAKAQDETFDVVDRRVREALMREPQTSGASLAELTPAEREIAAGYKAFAEAQVAENRAFGIRPGEKHAHIEALRGKAAEKLSRAEAQRRHSDEYRALLKRQAAESRAEGDLFAGARSEPSRVKEPFGPTPPKRELPSIDLIHEPYSTRPNIGPMSAEKAQMLRRLEEEGMLPKAMSDALRKRRGAEADASALAEQGLAGPEEFGHSMFRSVEKHTPKPRPTFGVEPKPAEFEPTKGLRKMFAAKPEPLEMGPPFVAGKSAVKRSVTAARREERIASKAMQRLNEKLKPSGIKVETAADLEALPSKLTGYAPQVISGEAASIKAAEKLTARGGSGRGRGFSAAQVERIVGDRTKTAAQKEAEFAAKHPDAVEPMFKGHMESALIRGKNAARRRATKLFLDDIGRRLGKPVDKVPKDGSWVRLTTLPVGKSGITREELRRLEGIAIPKREWKLAEASVKVIRDSSLGEAKNLVDSGFRAWKAWVLLRTGFPLRNAADNSIAVWAVGGKADFAEPAAKALAYSLGKADKVADEIIPGLGITYREYVHGARRTGALAGGFAQDVPNVGKKGSLVNRGLGKFREANAVNENYWRLVLDMSKRSEKLSPAEAGAWTDDILGKYDPRFLGPIEQKIGTYIFPWYNWMKQVTKRSLILATRFPGRVGQAAEAVTEINRGQGFTPEMVEELGPDVKESGAIVRKSKRPGAVKGDVDVFSTTAYGPTDINRIFGARELGPLAILANPANQSYPPVQWLATIAGLDTYRGRAFRGVDTELPAGKAKVLRTVYPDLAKNLGIRPVRVGNETRYIGPDKLAVLMRQDGPIGSAISDIGSRDPDARNRTRAFFLGFSEMVRNPETSRMIEAYKQKNVLREDKSTLKSSARAEMRLMEKMRREQSAK